MTANWSDSTVHYEGKKKKWGWFEMTSQSYSGKGVLITGASSGIGESAALHFDSLGFRVYAGVRREEDADRLERRGRNLTPLILDVTRDQDLDAARKRIEADLQEEGLFALVNNAGITVVGPLEMIEPEEFKECFDVNLFGAARLIRYFLPLLRKGKGRIINVSSTSGFNALPYAGAYAAGKYALEGLSESLRNELSPMGIHVVLLQPGNVATPIWGKVLEQMQKRLDNAPPLRKELYEAEVLATKRVLEKSTRTGISPMKVVETMEKALLSERPKACYAIGKSAKLQRVMKALLSTRQIDRFKRGLIEKNKTPGRKKDWSGKKYKVAEELGEFVEMIGCRYDIKADEARWYFQSHADSDGVGALTDILKREGIRIRTQPKMKILEKPTLPRRILLLFRYLRTTKAIRYAWKKHHPGVKGPSRGVCFAVFSREKTERISTWCRSKKVTVTSLLVWTLNDVVRSRLLRDQPTVAWLIPVNFRNSETGDVDLRNVTSSLSLRLPENASLEFIHSEIQGMYREGLQWGAWIYSNFIKYVGYTVVKLFYKYMNTGCWVGVCSNVGRWPPEDCEDNDENREYVVWYGAPPVTTICPVSTASISWRGRLVFNLQLHPSLSQNIEDTNEMMKQWIEKISERCGTSLEDTIVRTVGWDVIDRDAERL